MRQSSTPTGKRDKHKAHPRAARLRLLVCLGAAVAALAVVASPASALPCPGQSVSFPFLLPWLDPHPYVPVPGGSLEQGSTGWTLRDGASVVQGNEPFYVNSRADRYSLSLPAGSSAASAFMCVGLDYPTMRFFAQNTGDRSATLKVEMMIRGLDGKLKVKGVATVAGTSTWAPTRIISLRALLQQTLGPLDTTTVSFRFTASGGAWRIDDIYVDPFVGRR
jgi:hypothetical protein